MTEIRPAPNATAAILPHALHAGVAVVALGLLHQAGITIEVIQANGWWTAFIVVNVAIVAGNVAAQALVSAPDEVAGVTREGRRQDLIDSHDTVVQLLRNLEVERSKLAPADYESERAALLAIGANALRELEGASERPMQPADVSAPMVEQLRALAAQDREAFDRALASLGFGATAPTGMPGEWRGAAWTTLVFGLVAVLFTMAGGDARPRGEGQTMTGGDGSGASPMQEPGGGAPDPRLAELQKAVDANPTDIGALNRLTAAAIAAEDMAVALQSNQRAMAVNPEDADARTYNAVLKAFIGRKDEALLQLEEIGRAFPNRSAAFVYRGLLLLESDPATALIAFEAAAKVDPNPEIQQMIEVARRRAAAGPGAVPGAQSTPAPGASPGSPAGAAEGSAAGGEVLASGTIKLTDPARAAGKSALFVFLRAPGGGPPFAAVKLAPGPFPMDFSITRANLIPMMAGRPLPPTLELQARLDADGNATTRDEPETAAILSPFQPGTTGAALDLK